MLVPIRKLGQTGVITPEDYPAEEAPPNAMTEASSVMFRGGYVRKAAGWQPEIIDFTEDQQWMQGWDNGVQVSIAFGAAAAIHTTTDGQTLQESTIISQGGDPLTLSPTEQWQSDVFGKFCIMNNGVDTPLYSVEYDGVTDSWTFQEIPGWGQPNAPGGPVEVIMEFREHLLAIGVAGSPFTVYCSSTPESAQQITAGTLVSGIGFFASMEMGQAIDNLYAELVSTIPFSSAIQARGFPIGTLVGRTSFTSTMQVAVPPAPRVVATIPITATAQMECVNPYAQNRIANNSLPSRAYVIRGGTITTASVNRLTLSLWARFDSTNAQSIFGACHYLAVGALPSMLRVFRDSTGNLILTCLDGVNNGIDTHVIGNMGTAITTTWHHLYVEIDFTAEVFDVWYDSFHVNTAIAFTRSRGGSAYPMSELNRWAVFANPNTYAGSGGLGGITGSMNGGLADFWLNSTNQIVEQFNSAGATNIGSSGQIPSGATPLLLFGGDMTLTTGGGNNTGWTGTTSTVHPHSIAGATAIPFTRNNTFTTTT